MGWFEKVDGTVPVKDNPGCFIAAMGLWLLGLFLTAAFWIAVIVIAIHFVRKFW